MNLVERVVRGFLEEPPEDTRRKVQLSPRISADHYELLDALAERLKTTKHGLAQELLEAAIEDAGHLAGVEIVRADDGGTEVALFDNPLEKE